MAWKYRVGMTSMMWGFDADITLTEASMARAFPYFAIVVSYGNVALLYEAPHYKTNIADLCTGNGHLNPLNGTPSNPQYNRRRASGRALL